jgi:biopolymer transport protein ExbB/TolQ
MGLQHLFLKLSLIGVEWVVWVLLFLSIISIAIMVERGIFFYKIGKVNFNKIYYDVNSLLHEENYDDAINYLKKQDCVEGRVALAGLMEASRGYQSAEEAMLGERAIQKFPLQKHITFLQTISTNAPFLGLFGTVVGIMNAFHVLSTSNTPNLKELMFGIEGALVTTAVGLIVAIPAVIATNMIKRRIVGIMTSTENLAHVVLAFLKDKSAQEFKISSIKNSLGSDKGSQISDKGSQNSDSKKKKTGKNKRKK